NVAQRSSFFRSLICSLTLASSETKGLAKALSASLGSTSGFTEHVSLFRSLSDSLGFVASFFRGSTVNLSASLGSPSSFADNTSFFRSLSVSWTMDSIYGRGSLFTENLQANFNTTTVLSGHYDCHDNLIVNCGTVSGSFAFLVVALGVLIFGIYVARQRRQSP